GPEDMARAEKLAKQVFITGAIEAGIAHLDIRVEQAFLRRDQGASSVDVDRSTLEDRGSASGASEKDRKLPATRGEVRHPVVSGEVGIARPSVEPEPRDADRSALLDESGAGVPGPAAVGR